MSHSNSRKDLWRKIGLWGFLFLLVIGFTLPGFIPPDSSSSGIEPSSPRLCTTDSDCTLSCEGQEAMVYCFQNLCQRNSCSDPDFYPFQPLPRIFSLQLDISGQVIDFFSRQKAGNLYVLFHDDTGNDEGSSRGTPVDLLAPGITLQQVLEKADIQLVGTCLTMDGTAYCSEEQQVLQVLVNGEEQTEFYPPREGDVVKIRYGLAGK